MTQLFTVNQSPLNGADAMFRFKTALKAAGWTVPASSDGFSYNSSGDQITTFSSGAGGMANSSAWFRLRSPDTNREFTIQRTASNLIYRIKYSAGAPFTGGSPGVTQTPSATEEGIILGSGTDASPTGATLFGTDAGYYEHIMCNNATPYEFYLMCYPLGGGVTGVGFVFDPLTNYDPGDVDPTIIYLIGSNSAAFTQSGLTNIGTCPFGWMKKGMVGASFTRIPSLVYSAGGSTVCPTNLGSNPHSGYDDELPILYARSLSLGAPAGYKGVSRVMRWRGTDRSNGSTISVSPLTMNRIVMNNVSLPWDGVTVPLV